MTRADPSPALCETIHAEAAGADNTCAAGEDAVGDGEPACKRRKEAIATDLEDVAGAFEVDCVDVCGLSLRILRRRSDFFAACAGDLPILSTGLVLWECANLLADYLGYVRWQGSRDEGPWWQLHPPAAALPSRFWQGKRVLELGGGCGLVSAALACFGASVLCTDGDEAALRTAEKNTNEARRRYSKDWGSVRFQRLSWGKAHDDDVATLVREHGPFDYIVGSDLLYGDKAPAPPLVDTLAALSAQPGSREAMAILALKNRCANELREFRNEAERRELWDLRVAPPEDLLDGFDGNTSKFYGGDGPLYNVVHLELRASGRAAGREGAVGGDGAQLREASAVPDANVSCDGDLGKATADGS
eukprot:TRINITY_DN39208_c0_g1_i1.p1 TRINITY_DN39208_c0_g1~~TRINITY_DN39208_c0_g1_i1.p1  ORF type:complete len:380 (-),score=88.38 TRINITY_DN39208_c0_g1_i1:84-1166(-)